MDPAPFEVRTDDPFHLYATTKSDAVSPYIDEASKLDLLKFLSDLFASVEKAVDDVFDAGENPTNLRRVTANSTYRQVNLDRRTIRS